MADMQRVFRKILVVMAVLQAAFLVGCADEVGGVYLVDGQESKLHAGTDQVATVFFTAGGAWTATPKVDWLDVLPQSGEGGRNSLSVVTKVR